MCDILGSRKQNICLLDHANYIILQNVKSRIKNITWICCPGQAGVDGNGKADQHTREPHQNVQIGFTQIHQTTRGTTGK